MSLLQDPFYVVKEEVQQSVNGVTTLYDRWQELLRSTNTAQNDEFKWTTNQLKTGIRSIEWDLQDLEETIGIVESNRQRFKLDQAEVENRKKFITETKSTIKKMKDDLNNVSTKGKMDNDQRASLMTQKKTKDSKDRFSRLDDALQQDNDNFIGGHHQQQEQIILQQDEDLDALSHTVTTLGRMGEAIHVELGQQSRILDDLDGEVNKTSGRLGNVMRRLNKLLESTNDRVQWCIIIVLILILIGLVVIVFYV
jgi:syntaxin 6